MHVIKEAEWGQVSVFTWGELAQHQWIDFRIALMETETELASTGVAVEHSYTTATTLTDVEGRGVKVVQSSAVMRTRSEMIVSIVVAERDYKSEMIKYLPLYERKSTVFNEILNSYDREFRNTEQRLTLTKRNLFLDTAIESLPIFERDLGIGTVNTLRYDQRREQISSRYRAAFDQTTEETIKSVAAAYSNGEVEINKSELAGVYEIKFTGTRGIPNNMAGLEKALDIIFPAHLGWVFNYTFATWQDVSRMTWGEVASMTWNDLRNWEEVS
ncbi:putative phage tail protein [Sporosarcina cyprini]|uniref:putative phage tail protein n=1 Tax=Sporosarcina cyprini TaxID=2910523 RepID=UPI001EDE1994|nr:putative phage tail protein [Sporosarcina cyprini]MCG3089122.1 YmfQ family protein [Sporosarcina cyprini]